MTPDCAHDRIKPLSEKYTGPKPFLCLDCGKRFSQAEIYDDVEDTECGYDKKDPKHPKWKETYGGDA